MTIKSPAAVAYRANEPLRIETIEVAPPQEGEVLVEIKAAGLCHTDLTVLEGKSNMLAEFPGIPGHEAAGVVVEAGPGVTTLRPGDHVVPSIAECGVCSQCTSGKTNLCAQNVIDFAGHSRFSLQGRRLFPFQGLGTFSQFTVVREICLAKVRQDAPFDALCYFGCAAITGLGAVLNTARVTPGSSVIVFGLGGIGLNIVQGARLAGAGRIVAVDKNAAKEAVARKLGATDFVNSAQIEGDLAAHLSSLTDGGADFTFEAVGDTNVMRLAFEAARMGWGVCTIVGLAPDKELLQIAPFNLLIGKKLQGTAMGGVKTRTQIPQLVDLMMQGRIDIASLVTTRMPLEQINEGYGRMKRGEGIRSIVTFS